ncbi:MAG: DUF3362 domain-containing protein [Myxococcota bacterium]
MRDALVRAGREDLIGDGPECLIPSRPPAPRRNDRDKPSAGGRPLPYRRASASGGGAARQGRSAPAGDRSGPPRECSRDGPGPSWERSRER